MKRPHLTRKVTVRLKQDKYGEALAAAVEQYGCNPTISALLRRLLDEYLKERQDRLPPAGLASDIKWDKHGKLKK